MTGVDLSPAMLAIAQAKPVIPDAAPIHYQQASADRLPVADAGETLDAISGHFRIFQLAKGHRFSTDDVLTAFYHYPAKHWTHLHMTNCIQRAFATVRLRSKLTKGPARGRPGSRWR